jgi:hypothetical protein
VGLQTNCGIGYLAQLPMRRNDATDIVLGSDVSPGRVWSG